MSDKKQFTMRDFTDEQKTMIAVHEALHQMIGQAPRPVKLEHPAIARDVVVNAPDGKTLNWRGLMAAHMGKNFTPNMPESDLFTVVENMSSNIGLPQMREFIREVIKIKRDQRLGYRCIKARANKAARKAKKFARRA